MNFASLKAIEYAIFSGLWTWSVGKQARDVGKMIWSGVVQFSVSRLFVILGDYWRRRGR